MVYSRKFKKKKVYRRKRSIKKRNPLSKNVSNSMRYSRFKLQGYVSVVNDVAAGPQFDYKNCYALNFPGYYTNNSGTYGPILNNVGAVAAAPPLPAYNRYISAMSDTLGRLMNTFDSYKVMSMRVDWMPFADRVYTSTTQDNSLAFASTLTYVKDLDDSALIANYSQALNNAQRPLSMNRKATLVYRQPSITRNQWFNCQNITVLPGDAPNQGNVMPENAYKSLKVWCANIPTNYVVGQPDFIGRFYITWDVLFKGLNSALAPLP